MCSPMIVCVLLPRFALAVAAGGREALAAGPVALAPELGREQLIGEASAAAEAYGVRAGLRLGEALARCPTLRLAAPHPGRLGREWGRPPRGARGPRAARWRLRDPLTARSLPPSRRRPPPRRPRRRRPPPRRPRRRRPPRRRPPRRRPPRRRPPRRRRRPRRRPRPR